MKKIIILILIITLTISILLFYFLMRPNLYFKNILFITIDTIRADHLSCYGYKKIKTKNIDDIAARGILFTNAFCQVPLTLPSHVSIMTGLFPNHHGVRNNGSYIFDKKSETLAQVLKSQGYKTAAFISAYVLDRRFGLDYGFDLYDDEVPINPLSPHNLEAERKAEEVSKKAIQWLKNNGNNKFFLWIHYYDPHSPYSPPKEYRDKYEDPYDGEIAYVDDQIGLVINSLKEINAYSDTLIIIVGDHGESFGEHKEFTHGMFLYDATIHIPLIIKFPKYNKPKKINSLVRSIDLFPTILELLHLRNHKVDGRSLIPLINFSSNQKDLWNYAETLYPNSFKWASLFSIRNNEWKLIEAPKPELYNLAKDPEENFNFILKYPDKAKKLRELLQAVKENEKSSTANYIDAETREKLQALGYISSYSKIDKSEELPDPKDKIEYWLLLRKAQFLLGKNPEEGLEILINLNSEDTYTAAYSKTLSSYFQKIKDWDNAIYYINEAIKRDNDNSFYWYDLAYCYAKKGMLDEAMMAVQQSIALYENNPEAYNLRGTLLVYKNYIDEALENFMKALENDLKNSTALANIGNIYFKKQEFQKAEYFYQESLKYNPSNPNTLNGLGVISMHNKNYLKAIDYFKRALEADPEFYECYFNIALAYISLKEYSQSRKYLERLIIEIPAHQYPELYARASQILRLLPY